MLDRRVSIDKVGKRMQISNSSAYEIIVNYRDVALLRFVIDRTSN